MRLNQHLRDRIVSTVVKTTFAQREANLKAQRDKLLRTLVEHYLTPEQLACMDKLPMDFFPTTSVSFKADLPGFNFYECFHFRNDTTPAPHCWHFGAKLVTDEGVANEIAAYVDVRNELKADKSSCEGETKSIVSLFPNTNKLLAHWPTLRELMGEDFFEPPVPANLPVSTINTLDEALKVGMKAAA